MMNPIQKPALIAVALLTLAACNQTEVVKETVAEQPPIVKMTLDTLQPGEVGLASVNGSIIGSEDLSVYMARTVGSDYAAMADANLEKNVLESLIASRAISQKSLESMSNDERLTMEKRVAQFREELLVKRYLLEHATPEAIGHEDIRVYYDSNAEEFAGKEERLYEFLTVSPQQYKSNPSAAMELISSAKTERNWAEFVVRANKAAGISLVRNTQSFVGEGSGSSIEKSVIALTPNKMSKVIFENGAPYIAKLISVSTRPSKSFEESRAEISKRLLPARIKGSVKKLSSEILATAKIEYFEEKQ